MLDFVWETADVIVNGASRAWRNCCGAQCRSSSLPRSAERADQLHGGSELPLGDGQRGTLAGEKRGLLGRDLEITNDACAILIHRDIERTLRRSRRGSLSLCFVLEQPLSCEIVFNVLKRRKHRLPVDGDSGVVVRDGLCLD